MAGASGWRQVAGGLSLLIASSLIGTSPLPAQEDPPVAAVNLFREAADRQNEGDFELAADIWSSFLRRFPELELAHRARHYHGVCLMQLGNVIDARDEFAAVVEAADENEDEPFPLMEEALLNLGGCEFRLARIAEDPAAQYTRSAAVFARLLRDFDPGQYVDQALYFHAESLYLVGQAEESLPSYQRLVDEFPRSAMRENGLYALAVALEDLDRHDRSTALYEQFLEDYPESPLLTEVQIRSAESELRRGIAAENAGQTDQANEHFAAAERVFADAASIEGHRQRDHALYQQAFCVYKLGRAAQAAELYAIVAGEFPNSPYRRLAALSAGRSFFKSGQLPEAFPWLEQVRRDGGPDAVEAAHWICRIHLQQNDPQSAYLLANGMLTQRVEGEFVVSLMLDRADAANLIPDRKSSAYALYLEIATEHPDHVLAPQASYFAAYAAFESREYAQALEHCDAFLQRYASDPLATDVYYVQGESHLQTARYAEAEAAFRRLLDSAQNRPERETWQLRLALSMYLQDKLDATLAYLRERVEGLTGQAAQAEAHHLIGACSFRKSDFAAAQAALSRALEVDASWAQADESLLMLARSLFRLGRTDDAIATATRLVTDFPQSSRVVEAHYRIGEFRYDQEEYQAAIDQYLQVIDHQNPQLQPYALDGIAWSHLKLEDYALAAESFSRLISEHAGHDLIDNAYFGRAICANQARDHASAIDDLNRYLSGERTPSQRANGLFERGLAEIGLERFAAAATTLEELLEEHEGFGRIDQVLYELAWCYLEQNQDAVARQTFARIVNDYPESRNRAEAHFHIAEAYYRAEDYGDAAEQYVLAQTHARDDRVGERATYKLGWSRFHLREYTAAREAFSAQVNAHPEGGLRLEADFMIAECHYRQNEFEQAADQYLRIWPAIRDVDTVETSHKASILLHGAQSAGQVRRWDEALELANEFLTRFSDAGEVPEAWLQVGRAHRGLGNTQEAIDAFESAALQSQDHVGARARCMIGEVYMGMREYDEAQTHFRRVIRGFGGENATPEVKEWQAFAAFEAARCSHVRIADANGDERQDLIDEAKSYYRDVVTKYAESPYADQARQQLDSLSRLD